jgi:hypothetical protein
MTMRSYVFLVCMVLVSYAAGQGCSDAGVCTAGPMGELALTDSGADPAGLQNMVRLGFGYGIGETGVTIGQFTGEFNYAFTERDAFQFRIPFVFSSGALGSLSGIGDPLLTVSHALVLGRTERLDALAGVKLATNTSNGRAGGRTLPMVYQTSLGTTDLLLGLNYRKNSIRLAIAYQHVLHNSNENLQRSSDLVLRGQYLLFNGKVALQPGLLAIVHLNTDRYGQEPLLVEVPGSDGLTLNITLDVRYNLSDHWALEFSAGTPMITRKARPDGLTRSLVASLAIAHRF